jgi:hypothetical protein
LALEIISKDFDKHHKVIKIDDDLLQENLFNRMDLDNATTEMLCTHIHSDKFWKIACKKKYNVSVSEEVLLRKTHKNIFIENYLQNYLKTEENRSREDLVQMMSKIGSLIVDLKVTDHVFGDTIANIFYYLTNIRKLVLNIYSNTESELKISSFGMSPHTFEILTNCFETFKKLEHLDLGNNQIDLKKINFLAQNLQHLHKLSHLSLSKNKINNQALLVFSNLWNDTNSSPELTTLDLSYNDLRIGCGNIIENIIQKNANCVKNLYLDGNLIANSDVQCIFNAVINYDCGLKYLNLSNNLIDGGIFGIFIDFILKAKDIEFINLELNDLNLSIGQYKILNETLEEVFNLQKRRVKVKIDQPEEC